MKQILITLCLLATMGASAATNYGEQDTIIVRKRTVIEINEDTNDTIVKIIKTSEPRFHRRYESYIVDENNNYFTFFWKKKKNKKRLKPHWSGIGMGFMSYNSGSIPHGGIKVGSSHNFTFNFVGFGRQLGQSNFLLVSGLGLEWSRYHFDENAALTKIDGVTRFEAAPAGVTYKDSKLLVYYLTVPLLLEYQQSDFHLSGGMVAYFKYYSKSQVKYSDATGMHRPNMGRDLNIRPVDFRLRGQIGFNCLNFYALYAPWSMFKNGEGPDLKTYTFGLLINF